MQEIRSVWAWVISRFALARVLGLAASGTPSGTVALNGARDAASPCPYAHLLRASAAGNFVLVMDASATTKSLSLLLSDDHTLIGDALAHVFKTAGYVVERVFDGNAACDRIAAALDQFDALITDHRQPRLSGVGLVESLRRAGFVGRILVYSAALSPAEMDAYRTLKAEPIVVEQSEAARLLAIMKTLHGEK